VEAKEPLRPVPMLTNSTLELQFVRGKKDRVVGQFCHRWLIAIQRRQNDVPDSLEFVGFDCAHGDRLLEPIPVPVIDCDRPSIARKYGIRGDWKLHDELEERTTVSSVGSNWIHDSLQL